MIRATALNLSESGLFIHTDRPFPVDYQPKIKFSLGETRIRATGIVRYCESGVGFGMQFTGLDQDQQMALRAYIRDILEKSQSLPDGQRTVLLVEDSSICRTMSKSALLLEGYKVLSASNGMEALNILSSKKIDLIVLDLNLPDLSGYKVLAMIRTNPIWQKTPILVYSARACEGEKEKAIVAGANEFISKSTTPPKNLAERIKVHLK
ncbi:MAG: response regulator [Nitrospiraceae bacterium]|nr:response regulator [Nitrospiraceae bacterium]